MTITVRSISSPTSYNLPYYKNMRAGQFVTQIAAPALGCAVDPESGDVHERFMLDGAIVFTAGNKDKYLSDLMQDGATLYHTPCLGRIPDCLFGNGCHSRPTKYQLVLDADAVGQSAFKKQRVSDLFH